MGKSYTASKSRTQGRGSWAVIFRHPVRIDPATGRAGRRVRRGLGTADDAEADRLVAQLNEILGSEELWEPSARVKAAGRYDELVVDLFFDGMEAAQVDFGSVRDGLLPLPGETDGYRQVLLIGTTGVGKTTVVRQLLGIDPRTERFPSTLTAKTTVADTEIVLAPGEPFRAAVTFAGRDEVVDHLTENVAAAALGVYQHRSDGEVIRRLLDHVNQRFRFSYVLGRPGSLDVDDDDLDDEADLENAGEHDGSSSESQQGQVDGFAAIDVGATESLIADALSQLKRLVERETQSLRDDLAPAGSDDERVVEELLEETLDSVLRDNEDFHRIVDALMEEIELRFLALSQGELRRSRQGWPQSWSFVSEDRGTFLKEVSRFTSNYAPLFGRLLTPLINGIRVSGPFAPSWSDAEHRLVLIDVEGLGHTPKSTATLSTTLAKRVEDVDAVLLVDNATQPMQAAPVAALKSIAVAGSASKLFFLFTHLDAVVGDNLPRLSDREEHVLASVENVLRSIGEDLGPAAERALRRRLDSHRFFAGTLNVQIDTTRKAGRRSTEQLRALASGLASPEGAASAGNAKPVFNRMNLSLAITEAARSFHEKWRGLLGLAYNADAPKEHWTRVKALTRRLGEGWDDEYDDLRPVADLRYQLQRQIWLMLQRPVRWEGCDPDDNQRLAIIDQISNAVTQRLFDLTTRRLKDDVQNAWLEAYAQRGTGSTFVRAGIIADKVYGRGAPIPTVAASRDQNSFMADVATLVAGVADELDLVLE